MSRVFFMPFALALLVAAKPATEEVATPKMPLVAATLYFPFGAATESEGRRGATRVVFDWLEAGTKRRTAEQVSDRFLESGARYLANVDINYSTATVEAPEDLFPQAWQMLLEVLREPKLAEADLKSSVQKHLTQKKSRLTDAKAVAKELAYSALYAGSGEGANPNGVDADVAGLTPATAADYYQKTIGSGPAVLFVSSSMPAAVRREVETSIAGWGGAEPARDRLVSPVKGKLLVLVERPGSTQAYIDIAKVGPPERSDERPYVALATELLGGNGAGGGDNLLFKELRAKQGLTYHASIQTWRRPDRDTISGFTFGANENVPKLIGEYLRVWSDFLKLEASQLSQLGVAELRVKGTEERERATVYQAMMLAAQIHAAGGLAKDLASPDPARYEAAKVAWLKQDDYVVLVFGDQKLKEPILAALGPGARAALLPESADWAEINAAVLKLSAPAP